jgi:hypothetical protein
MTLGERARPIRRIPTRAGRVLGLLVVLAVLSAVVGRGLLLALPSPVATSSAPSGSPVGGLPGLVKGDAASPGGDAPDVANLDPALRSALRAATSAAGDDGVGLRVTSGWRSREHQARLLREAVTKYGSPQEAARWVATPETSAHVSGDAVDVGPPRAAAWLAAHGAAYGLCPVYRNEPWHFELRPDAPDGGCPAVLPDPTYDPRMHP